METEKKNRLREFGVFLGLAMFPIILIVLSVYTAAQRVIDYMGGFTALMPNDYGVGLAVSLVGCLVILILGSFILWAAMPKYEEYLK